MAIKNYQKIINEIIEKSFPELGGKVNIKLSSLKVGSMLASKKFKGFQIMIDVKKYSGASDAQLIGALAHELVHFENYSGIFGWLRYWVENFAFYFSKFLMAKFEKNTDEETIRRGYAKELYLSRVFRLKNISKKYAFQWAKCYLSPEEIKSYAQEIGRWQ